MIMRGFYSANVNKNQRNSNHGIPSNDGLYFRIAIVCLFLFLLMACAHGSIKNPQANLFEDTLQIYRGPLDHLSAVRRGVCPMHPSCSEYGRQAVQKHGFLIGWAMAMDRLLRCGRDELNHIPRIWVAGDWKFYDPVWANDDWWHTGANQQVAQE